MIIKILLPHIVFTTPQDTYYYYKTDNIVQCGIKNPLYVLNFRNIDKPILRLISNINDSILEWEEL